MTIKELKLGNVGVSNATVDDAIITPQPQFVDRSEMLFSYMNMIAFNNKVDLKINNTTTLHTH